MHHDDVPALRPNTVQNRLQVVQRMIIADWHEHTSGPDADALRAEIFLRGDVKLIHFDVRRAAISVRNFFRHSEYAKHDERENQAGDGRAWLSKQVHDRDEK